MNDGLPLLALSLGAGVVLGAAYFGGLWWTVRSAVGSRATASVLLTSWFVRTVLLVLGFVAVMQGDWRRLAVCMLGFTLSRTVLLRWLGGSSATSGGERCT